MFKQLLTTSLFIGLSASTLTPTSAMADMEFCDPGDNNCEYVLVLNKASVLVTKVKVTQSGTGCVDNTKTHSGNLVGGDGFDLWRQTNCKTVVKFVTTDGCSGDKKVTWKANNGYNEDVSVLRGACNIDLTARKAKSGV